MLSVLIAEAACARVNIYASVMEYWRTRTCLEGVDSRADIVCEEKKDERVEYWRSVRYWKNELPKVLMAGASRVAEGVDVESGGLGTRLLMEH
jgi:hypothetical protein